MTSLRRALLTTSVAGLMLAACGTTPSPTLPPGASQGANPSVAAPSVAAPSAAATTGAAAGEPCSFLTAEAVGAVMGTIPVEVEERAGRGDCDYWLTAAKDQKVNIAVVTGADAASAYESIKAMGGFEPVALGDEAFWVSNAGFGTIVAVRTGDSTVSAQVFAGDDPAEQLRQATALATAVIAGL